MGTVRDALQLPDMRRIKLGYGMSITGELAGTVALVVYAFGAGGAALVAAYAASRTVAGMAVALVLTGITSRLRRGRVWGSASPGSRTGSRPCSWSAAVGLASFVIDDRRCSRRATAASSRRAAIRRPAAKFKNLHAERAQVHVLSLVRLTALPARRSLRVGW